MKQIITNRNPSIYRMMADNANKARLYEKPEYPLFSFYAFPGGYQLIYITADNGVLCAACANNEQCNDRNDDQFYIVDYFIHWEGESMYCDHCNAELESEYGIPV